MVNSFWWGSGFNRSKIIKWFRLERLCAKNNICLFHKLTVCNLLHGQKWNMDLINNIFSIRNAYQILNIDVANFRGQDTYIWGYIKDGKYFVNSEYNAAIDNIAGPESSKRLPTY